MRQCLYCQASNPDSQACCSNCSMPLPNSVQPVLQRKQRRFLWFCIALGLFCLLMMLWLPRGSFIG